MRTYIYVHAHPQISLSAGPREEQRQWTFLPPHDRGEGSVNYPVHVHTLLLQKSQAESP